MKEDESNSLLLKIKSMLIRKFDICKKLIIESESKIKQNVELSDSESSEDEIYDQIEDGALTDDDLIGSTNGDMDEIEDDIDTTNEDLENSIIKCNRVLRFLQLLCENHNLQLQNFLRVQDHDGLVNNKSFDFVSHISLMFGKFIKEYTNCYSSDLGDQLMATLTELIQGPCKENQTSLINCKVIDNCTELIFVYNSKKVLRQKGFIGKYEIELDELKQHCVTLLLSLIEGKCDEYIKKQMTQAIDNFLIVFQRMDSIYKKFVKERLNLDPNTTSLNSITNHLQKDSFDDSINEGFELFILIKLLLVDKDPSAVQKYKEFEAQLPDERSPESLHRSMQFYQKFTGTCEVVVNDDLFKVYFPILPICRFLSPDSKKYFLENVSRDSPQHKINGLLAAIPDFMDEMEHTESLRHGKIKITPKVVSILRDITLFFALVINSFILFDYEYVSEAQSNGSETLKPQLGASVNETILPIFGIVLISL